jgi:signal transduction histidine kinase
LDSAAMDPGTLLGESGAGPSSDDQPTEATAPDALTPPMRLALQESAEVILAQPSRWRSQALNPEEAQEVMARLVGFIAEDESGRALDPDVICGGTGGTTALALRLNELLRQELLRDPRDLGESELLGVLRRVERCRLQVEPSDHQGLAVLLTGANAMELVVEFAHDLRSPLTSIMFLSDTLRRGQSGEINDVQREQLGIMYSAALGMVGVANDLMDLARSEVDDAWHHSSEEPFSVQELVEKTRKMVAPMAEQKRLKVSFITPRHDFRIGHPVLLGRVLLNLVTNALKFTEEGRVEIVVQENPGERLFFSVRDTGRGIDEKKLEDIYRLFERSHSSTGYHFSGTGLGLSICRRLVELQGGELKVESEPGRGSRFFFELKLPRAAGS